MRDTLLILLFLPFGVFSAGLHNENWFQAFFGALLAFVYVLILVRSVQLFWRFFIAERTRIFFKGGRVVTNPGYRAKGVGDRRSGRERPPSRPPKLTG